MTVRSFDSSELVYEEDLDLLKDYQSNGRPLVDVLIEQYLPSSGELVAAMEKALGANDLKAYSRAAHSLKSSSRSLGLRPLGDLSEQAERAEALSADAAARFANLRKMHEQCCELLSKRLAKNKGAA